MILIGVTGSREMKGTNQMIQVNRDYLDGILRAGGMPVLLPYPLQGKEMEDSLFDQLDGLLLTGGADADPVLYGRKNTASQGIDEDRDRMEMTLLRLAIKEKKPFLAICRGEQMLNIACGGTLHQDILTELPLSLQHARSDAPRDGVHEVHVQEGTLLSRIIGKETIAVNSRHHQAVECLGEGLIVNAVSTDGIVEGIELQDHPFALGVQWHPESMAMKEKDQQRLFECFIQACVAEKEKK